MALGKLGRRGGVGTLGGLGRAGTGAQIQLSNASFVAGSAQGTAIGTLSVTGGTGTYTFTLTDSATNKVQVAGTNGVNLQAGSAAASAGSFNITVHADNGAGSVLDRTFLITATGSAALKFNAASNSQYVPLLEDI
jgi:hypothetical protein